MVKANKITSTKHRVQGWGTTLDDERTVPTRYSGLSFDQAWHEDMERWDELPDKDKWEMAYWVERQALKRGLVYGLTIGLLIGAIAGFVVGQIL